MNLTRRLLRRNFSRGRAGLRPLAIVDHVMEGSMVGTWSHFNRENPRDPVSAHYGVSRSGEVVQYVEDEDTAWHAGRMVRPTAPLVLEMAGVSPNLYTIGIEHEGYAHTEPTPEQMQASAQLHALLSKRHGIPLDRRHVIGHREIRADKTCPGRLDLDEILRLALPPEVVPRPGARRWSRYFGEYLVLTRFVSDREWFFLPESQLKRQGIPATVRWSDMPREP